MREETVLIDEFGGNRPLGQCRAAGYTNVLTLRSLQRSNFLRKRPLCEARARPGDVFECARKNYFFDRIHNPRNGIAQIWPMCGHSLIRLASHQDGVCLTKFG